jgi:hypothetical protein
MDPLRASPYYPCPLANTLSAFCSLPSALSLLLRYPRVHLHIATVDHMADERLAVGAPIAQDEVAASTPV